MHRAVSAKRRGRWPHPRDRVTGAVKPALRWEIVIGLATFGVYALVTAFNGEGRRQEAAAHSRSIFHVEQTLHIDIEPSINHWLLHHDVLRVIANYEYAFTYIVSAAILLVWLYVTNPDVYRWARTSFVLLNLYAICCFFLYPVMPPRMLPSLGFVDTVTQGHTFGSWGSGAVDDANSLAAMPSLHLAWALWVSVVLSVIAGSILTQSISFVHVMTTLFVIMATANHYLLDAVGGAVFVFISVWSASLFSRKPRARRRPERIPAADAFFLYVERPDSPQLVGGLMHLAHGEKGPLTRDEVEARIRGRIELIPRFTQRLGGSSRWRRPRWIDVEEIDWGWHVAEFDLRTPDGRPGGVEALNRMVADLQATLLPRDRPLWRVAVFHGLSDDTSGAVIIAHHVIADGFGTIKQAVRLLLSPEISSMDALDQYTVPMPKRIAATAAGLAQLATDSRPKWRAEGIDLPGRSFGTVSMPLADVRELARRLETRMTDLVLTIVAGGLARTVDRELNPSAAKLRVSVTLMVPRRGSGDEGNATAAAMIDVPLDDRPAIERLRDVNAHSARLRTGTRPMASRFVMDALAEVLPPILHAWFARTVYGPRYFHAIASNMPGPTETLDLAGHELVQTYPILPLAPGSPVAVGALSVSGRLGFGISVHPYFVPDVAALQDAMRSVYEELAAASCETGEGDFATSSRG